MILVMPKNGQNRKTAAPIVEALSALIKSVTKTYDPAILMPGTRDLSCAALGKAVVDQIETL